MSSRLNTNIVKFFELEIYVYVWLLAKPLFTNHSFLEILIYTNSDSFTWFIEWENSQNSFQYQMPVNHRYWEWYCQYRFTHFTQKFWVTVQWNKYPCSVAEWIFVPLRPPICLSYPSNICGASLPEAFHLSTSISGGYSNNSCSSARSLFSAALSCNPYFFCRGCKTAHSSFV